MHYNVIVIGAGMVGTSIAWHLQNNSSQVLLLDKKPPGSETSYGNAGLIQREAIHVYPFPREIAEIARVLPNQSTDIRYRWSALLNHRHALLKYWQNSTERRVEQIEQQWKTLIEHSTSEHQRMISAAKADDLVRKVGWIAMYRSPSKLRSDSAAAKKVVADGIEHRLLSIDELQQLEPNGDFSEFVGAIHWSNSWQVTNPGALVKAYAANFQAMRGTFKQAGVQQIIANPDSWEVVTTEGRYSCDDLVIAAGPWSNQLIEPLGYQLPLFPMRGYHQHFVATNDNTINHSLVDMDKGFVMGPMQQGIRITTGAEMTLMSAPKDLAQLQLVLKYAKRIIPLDSPAESEAWCGSRPCMADMKPVIGAAGRHDNLWFAFGHGHQGFTLGPITGRLIEEMIHGKPLAIDPTPFDSQRF